MAQFELVFDEGGGKTYRVPVSAAPLTIGRSAENQIRVEHPAVSRIHVSLRVAEDRVLVEYMGSGKGVKVNGERTTNACLKHGDRIEVGETTFTVNDVERATPPARPKLSPALLDRNSENRLFHKRDPKVREVFEHACMLAESTQDPARSVTSALALVLDLVTAQRCFLLWFVGGEGGVKVLGALAQDGNNKGPKLNGTLVNNVARLGVPMLKVDERPLPPEATGDRPSAMCVPLRIKRQVVGAVYIDSGWSGGHFTTHALQDARALVQVLSPMLLRVGSRSPVPS